MLWRRPSQCGKAVDSIQRQWTKLISRHVMWGKGREALQLYIEMREMGVIPDNYTFAAALKACSTIADLEAGKEIHGHVIGSTYHADLCLLNTLLDMYAKCRSIQDARFVFDTMPCHTVVSWNAMILGYAHMGMAGIALDLYVRMQHQGFEPNDRTFVAALKACGSLAAREEDLKLSCLEQGRAIHCEVVKRGLNSDVYVANTLLYMYAKCGSMVDACCVFEKMVYKDVVSWTAMILGYTQIKMGTQALKLYGCMQNEGFVPDNCTFVAALKACSLLTGHAGKLDDEVRKLRCFEHGAAIHAEVTRRGLELDIYVANSLIDMYAKCGRMVDARRVFERMTHHDVVSWNAIIMGYAQIEMGESALELFSRMQHEGFTPDDRTFVSTIKACGTLAAQEEGHETDGKLLKRVCLEHGKAIHREVTKRGFESDIYVANTLVDMYAKCGSMVDARRIFEKTVCQDVVSWNAIIMGYAQIEMGELALELFSCMQYEGVIPDDHTFAAALKACGNLGSLEIGKGIHAQLHRAGFESEHFVANCLVDMYSKCGSMSVAQQFFDSLPVRDSVTWSALMAGYSGQGNSEHVFDLYERMKQENIKPVGITFSSILTVCSKNGLVDKGQSYFCEMCLEHWISPSSKHYMCMVDLLGRAGQLDEAMAMLRKMPFRPDIVTWMTILGASQKWNHLDIGSNTFECATVLDNNYAAAYVLITNIYSFADMSKG